MRSHFFIERIELSGSEIGIFAQGAKVRSIRDAHPARLIGQKTAKRPCHGFGVGDRACDCRVRRPFDDMTDCGSHGRNADHCRLEHCQRPGFVPGRHKHDVGIFHQRANLILRQKAVKAYLPLDAEVSGQRLNNSRKGILSDQVKMKCNIVGRKRGERPHERRLVLHPIEAGDMHQLCRASNIARARHPGGPRAQVDPEWNTPQAIAEPFSDSQQGLACTRQYSRAAHACPDDSSAAYPQASSISDFRQAGKLSARNVYQGRDAKQAGGYDRSQTRGPGPKSVHKGKTGAPVFARYRLNGATDGRVVADIVNSRTEQVPRPRLWFLGQRKYVDLVSTGQALDQPHQCRNDPVLPRPVHAAWNDKSDFHR